MTNNVNNEQSMPPESVTSPQPVDDLVQLQDSVETSNLPSIYKKIVPFVVSIVGAFGAMFQKSIRWTVDFLFGYWLKLYDEHIAVHRTDIQEQLHDRLGLPQNIVNDVLNAWDKFRLLGFFFYVPLYFMGLTFQVLGHFKAIGEGSTQDVNKETLINLSAPELAISALIKGYVTGNTADELLDRAGVDPKAREAILGAIKQIAPLAILMENYYRGKITAPEFMNLLSRSGFDTDQQDLINNVLNVIPPVQDIIRMAVREAFTPELIEKFGYMADFPEEFANEGKKHGYTREWLMKYWIAHWVLPGPNQVFQMLHRGLIDEGTVDIYLRAADYPPYWREALKGIAYQPLTRVDVRRMYRIGTFDDIPGVSADEAVVKAYKDLGYNEYNSTLMLKFTKQFEGDEKKKLTESKILKLFRIGLIDEAKARDLLSKLKYRPEYLDYIIELTRYDREDELLDSLLTKLRKMFVVGRYSWQNVIDELSKENLAPVDTELLRRSWTYEKESLRRLPTRADVIRWYKLSIITKQQTLNRFKELGYSDDDAKNYIREYE